MKHHVKHQASSKKKNQKNVGLHVHDPARQQSTGTRHVTQGRERPSPSPSASASKARRRCSARKVSRPRLALSAPFFHLSRPAPPASHAAPRPVGTLAAFNSRCHARSSPIPPHAAAKSVAAEHACTLARVCSTLTHRRGPPSAYLRSAAGCPAGHVPRRDACAQARRTR